MQRFQVQRNVGPNFLSTSSDLVTLYNMLLSEPQFPHLQNGDSDTRVPSHWEVLVPGTAALNA